MPNRFTRVPTGPVPELNAAARLVMPVADLFMLAMWSRPATGSLRTTWVTPATLQLCCAVAILGAALGVAALWAAATTGPASLFIVAAVLLVIGAGSGAVAVVGIGQRLRNRA